MVSWSVGVEVTSKGEPDSRGPPCLSEASWFLAPDSIPEVESGGNNTSACGPQAAVHVEEEGVARVMSGLLSQCCF